MSLSVLGPEDKTQSLCVKKRERVNLIGKNCISKWILPQLLWVWKCGLGTSFLFNFWGCHFFLLLALGNHLIKKFWDKNFKKLNIYDQVMYVAVMMQIDIEIFKVICLILLKIKF